MKFVLERASKILSYYDGSEIDKKYNPRIECFDSYLELSDEKYQKELRSNHCVNRHTMGDFTYTQVRVRNKLKNYKVYKNEKKEVVIDISNLEDLLKFQKKYGEIIIGNEEINPFITMSSIMIYDSYIE